MSVSRGRKLYHGMMPADHVLWNECKIEWAAPGDAYDVAISPFPHRRQ